MLTAFLALSLAASARAAFTPSPYLAFDRTPQQLAAHCQDSKKKADMRLAELASLSPAARTFQNTPAALDDILWDLTDQTASDTFSKYVSVSSSVRDAANDCETSLGQYMVDVYTRKDLYDAVKAYADKKEKLGAEDARLLDKELLDFKRSGVTLPRAKREKLKELRRRIVELEADFSKNLNEVKDYALFTRAQLDGLPDDYISGLQKVGDKYKVTVDYPDYFPFMENAKDPDARKQLEILFDNRAYAKNEPLFKKALALREEAARLQGYKNHAAYVLEDRMAKDPRTVNKFLDRLAKRLKPLGKEELAQMVALKDKELGPKSDHVIHLWDWMYYDNMELKQQDVDKEKIKAYFPMETVTRGLLDVYQKLLSVKFTEIKDPAPSATWSPDVKLYEITDASGGPAIGYFYMDMYPRDGKYKHAASFDIVHARRLPDGSYQKPVSAIVVNFPKPTPGKPSLLVFGVHEDVETFFHEFGHIMHQTLTKADYGRFSGSNVAQDFVEAPSQMLENWVWDPQIIGMMSGRYDDPSKKLPKDLLDKMIAAKNVNVGLKNLRQLVFGEVDMDYHTGAVSDPTAVWAKVEKNVMMVPMTPGTHPEASFGHLMGGYDAGYYGYMWSLVYASDMFSVFQREGLLNPAVGRRYREQILEPGSSREEEASLEAFLGRKPNEDAFLRHIGLGPKTKTTAGL